MYTGMKLLAGKPYILDNGFFVIAREYYSEIFPSFWEKLDIAVKSDAVWSVREVQREIFAYKGEQQHLLEWVEKNNRLFGSSGQGWQNKVDEIYRTFPRLVANKVEKRKDPRADPFVIARAWEMEGVVVCRERSANPDENEKTENLHKMPDICKVLNVPCITPREFMREQGWRF